MKLNKNIINIYQSPVLLFDFGVKIANPYGSKAVRIDLFEVTSTTK